MKEYILRNKLNFIGFTVMMAGGYFVISDFSAGLAASVIFWIVWTIINLTCITPDLLIFKSVEPSKGKDLTYTHMLEIIGKLSDKNVGSSKEQKLAHDIANDIDVILKEQGVGEYDGDEFGNGRVSLFYFSNTPLELLLLIKPLIKENALFKSFSYTITEL